ncbi:MAG TPA: lipopolysaccharide assembly protein LapA domain-containing protein [Propionibacteriaceae bacterium]|nr:lipopolysaccharide assembly protein LapA domain-containing protein [Propionibacteriaceae bacterium]
MSSVFARTRSHFSANVPTPGPAADHADAIDPPGPPAIGETSPPDPGTAALPDAPIPGATAPGATAPGATDSAPPATGPAAPERAKLARTRIGGIWVAVVIAALVLVFLLIFILQNPTHVSVFFLGAAGTLPLGVAMLFAAIAGALLVALIGSARILQLRHTARRR